MAGFPAFVFCRGGFVNNYSYLFSLQMVKFLCKLYNRLKDSTERVHTKRKLQWRVRKSRPYKNRLLKYRGEIWI